MNGDEWVKVAMEDDSVVVELLLQLNLAQPPPSLTAAKRLAYTGLHLDWTVRQPRSRHVPRHVVDAKKKSERTGGSPTTPLSWSGATSASNGAGVHAADGVEESSRLANSSDGARSKIATIKNYQTTSLKKKSRKRKQSLGELKEEEILLLKERKNLKNVLSSLRLAVEKERSTNESLKKMKAQLDMQPVETMKTAPTLDQPQQQKTGTVSVPKQTMSNVSCKLQVMVRIPENRFTLPDLNLPFDELPGSTEDL